MNNACKSVNNRPKKNKKERKDKARNASKYVSTGGNSCTIKIK
jgi:hypothetical protein